MKLKELRPKFEEYRQTLVDAEEMLKKNKEKFKSKLLQQSDEFKKNISDLVNDFKLKGPFSPDIKADEVNKNLKLF